MRHFNTSVFVSTLAVSALSLVAVGCGNDTAKYQPKPAYTGQKASLPAPASVPKDPVKVGDAYTSWGASYHLRSRVHNSTIAGKDIKLTGFITKTNMPDAPECAVHETGKEDPEDCVAPVPTFWVADKADATEKESIKVMGWASNFAQLYDAIKEYKKLARQKKELEEPLIDNFWGVKIPDPLPVKGAKVTVTGNYSTTFTKATTGAEADPIMGIVTYDSMETLEPAAEVATLPGM